MLWLWTGHRWRKSSGMNKIKTSITTVLPTCWYSVFLYVLPATTLSYDDAAEYGQIFCKENFFLSACYSYSHQWLWAGMRNCAIHIWLHDLNNWFYSIRIFQKTNSTNTILLISIVIADGIATLLEACFNLKHYSFWYI
jgi:hypothetical protein